MLGGTSPSAGSSPGGSHQIMGGRQSKLGCKLALVFVLGWSNDVLTLIYGVDIIYENGHIGL